MRSKMRNQLEGRAEVVIEMMESDNGCWFDVNMGQAESLNAVCSREPVNNLTLDELETLAAGDHSEQLELCERHPDIKRLYELLNDVFDSCYDYQPLAVGGAHG
jgi:hypothetical protein